MKWLSFLLLLGCAQVTSLNLKKHQFGLTPTKIIWFQVGGLEEEQLAMLRFQHSGEKQTSFEENICLGKTWGYNLYQLRPSADLTFLAQLTGKKNIKGDCSDADHRPIWNFLKGHGFMTGILESGASEKESLSAFHDCSDKGRAFLEGLYMWRRTQPKQGQETFNYSTEIPLKQNQVFYDQTCNKNTCYSSISDNFKEIYSKFRKISSKHLLVVRDFSYLKALERKDFSKARIILADLERALTEALNYAKNSNDYLVLVSSGDSKIIDFPEQGKPWYEFEKTAANIQVKRAGLTNLVLAYGARAENFCGMYDDVQIFERILSGPKQQGLELKFINPFK
jgi:hypothetical protein